MTIEGSGVVPRNNGSGWPETYGYGSATMSKTTQLNVGIIWEQDGRRNTLVLPLSTIAGQFWDAQIFAMYSIIYIVLTWSPSLAPMSAPMNRDREQLQPPARMVFLQIKKNYPSIKTFFRKITYFYLSVEFDVSSRKNGEDRQIVSVQDPYLYILGLLNPHPVCNLFVLIRILPSTSKKIKKNLDLYCFVTSLWLFIFKEWCKCKRNKHKSLEKKNNFCLRLEGHWRKEQDPHPLVTSMDPYQNVTDPEHCLTGLWLRSVSFPSEPTSNL